MRLKFIYLMLLLPQLLSGDPIVTNTTVTFPTPPTTHPAPQSTQALKGSKPELVFIYGTAGQEIFMKNGSGEAGPIVRNASAQYMTFDEISETLYWTGTLLNTGGDEQGRVFQVTLKNGNVTTNPTIFVSPFFGENQRVGNLPVQIKWLEYDWLGDNIYFVDHHRGICICNRNSSCTVLVNESSIGGGLNHTKIVLDPERGSLYWSTWDGPRTMRGGHIVRADMDGTNATVIVPNVAAELLTVDRHGGLLFWLQKTTKSTETHGNFAIFKSNLDGKNVSHSVKLDLPPLRLRTAGDDIFFMDDVINASLVTYKNVPRPHMGDYDGLTGQHFHQNEDFYIYVHNSTRQKMRSPCEGRLCSHICVPKPISSGNVRCLCPSGFKLLADSRNCEEIPNEPTTKTPSMEIHSTEIPEKADLSSTQPVLITHPNIDPTELETEQTAKNNGSATISSLSDGTDRKWIIYLAVGAGGGALLLLGLIAIIVKLGRKAREVRDLTTEESSMFLSGDPPAVSDAPEGMHRALLLRYTQCFHPDSIQTEGAPLLGAGVNSFTYKGTLNLKSVVVKTMRPTVHTEEFKAILAEVKAMAYVKGHANLVEFLGADVSAITKRKIAIVTELSPKASLSHCLSEPALYGFSITPLNLVKYCEQIAAGMEYLASKGIIHGDLAARNVLVFGDDIVKITGFGRCKHSFTTERIIKRRLRELSWRWASIELLKSLEFSEESDVWAFGVTVWEIFSFGVVPFDGMKFNEKFTQYLEKGNRLTVPPCAPMAISQLLSSCWNWNPSNRPKFTQVREILQELLDRAYARSWEVSRDRLSDTRSLPTSKENMEEYSEIDIDDVSLELTTSV